MKLLGLLLLTLLPAGGVSERRGGKKPGVCRTPAGQVYTVGQSYTEDCVTYTCTKLGRKMTTLVPSVIGKCCEVKSRGLYQAGEIIEVTRSGPGNCTRRTVRCELTPHSRPQVTVNIENTANCCLYRGQPAQIGQRFPVPEKCAWLEYSSPSMELTSEYDGCHCCLAPATTEQFLIPDGERFLKSDGTELLCYKGSWINFDQILNDDKKELFPKASPLVEQTLIAANLSDLDKLRVNATIKNNLTSQVIISSQTNVQSKAALDVLYFGELGLRAVRSDKICLITKMENSFDFGKLALDFKHYTRSKKRWDMSFKISVKIENKTPLEELARSECSEHSIERTVDVEVTEEMFEKLYNFNLVTVGQNWRHHSNATDKCHVTGEIARPELYWETYIYDSESRRGQITRHLSLAVESPECCEDQGGGRACHCRQVVPFNLLHQCDWNVVAEEKCKVNLKHPTITIFSRLGDRIIIQERKCK